MEKWRNPRAALMVPVDLTLFSLAGDERELLLLLLLLLGDDFLAFLALLVPIVPGVEEVLAEEEEGDEVDAVFDEDMGGVRATTLVFLFVVVGDATVDADTDTDADADVEDEMEGAGRLLLPRLPPAVEAALLPLLGIGWIG